MFDTYPESIRSLLHNLLTRINQVDTSSRVNMAGDFNLNMGGRQQPVDLDALWDALAPSTATVNKASSFHSSH